MSLQVSRRPKSFKDIIGNESTIESLESVLNREDPPSTFLFTGRGGTGKTTFGRIVSKTLGCSDSDFTEINASDDTGIDSIRALRDRLKFSPLDGDKKVILMDECHQLSSNSQEALLKILEEPQPYVHFILCTTNPEKLKPTLKRRCHQYELSPLSPPNILKLIKKTLSEEKVEISKFPREVAEMIVDLADGSAGQAMKLLDMVIDMKSKESMLEAIKSVNVSSSSPEIVEICRTLLDYNMTERTRWLRLRELIKDLKGDAESARRGILGYMNKALLNKEFGDGLGIVEIMSNFDKNYYDSGFSGLSMSCYMCCMANDENNKNTEVPF